MKTSIVISLDTRRKHKDGTCPIIFRLTHFRKTTSIASGIRIPVSAWDAKKRKVRSSYKGIENISRANNMLEKTKAKYLDIINQLNEKEELNTISLTEVKDKLIGNNSLTSVFPFTRKMIDEFYKQERIGNARSYKSVLAELKRFRDNKDFSFNELTYNFLLQFEAYYLGRGLSMNGLAVYMKTIRAIYNRAIKENIISSENYPFKKYTIKIKPTKKRAIPIESIKKIIDLKYEANSKLFHTRNIFLMSFYLMGASFTDLAHFKVGNIVDGRIQYKRQKTGKFYDIKISEQLKEIINYYSKDKKKDVYLLPIIRRTALADQYKDVMWERKNYNKRLKQIGIDAKIDEKLTSYVSRHSFASIANNMAIPVTAISEMLGHQKLSTTQVYLKELNKDILDEYNEQIISF
ncbi:MAG: phage integrase SAM-like domain-containing protein [Hyphomicrobiales bacterium]